MGSLVRMPGLRHRVLDKRLVPMTLFKNALPHADAVVNNNKKPIPPLLNYNPGHFTSVLLFFGINFDAGMLKILKTRHLKAKIPFYKILWFCKAIVIFLFESLMIAAPKTRRDATS